jgi:hypothetical protein
MVPSLCDTATRIKDGLERGGLMARDVSNRLGERGPGSPGGCGDGGVGWKERMVWAGFALRSGFCAAIAHRVVHIPGSTLLGRRTDFGIFDLAVFRPFEQTIV